MLVGLPLIFFILSKVLGGGSVAVLGIVLYIDVGHCILVYPRYMLVAWAGYVRYVMLWLWVHEAREMG